MTRIKLLGHEITIKQDPDLRRSRATSGDTWMQGCVITIDPSLPTSGYEECLLHEIVENLNYRLELDLDHRVITSLSEGLFQVLTDNGMRTDWSKIGAPESLGTATPGYVKGIGPNFRGVAEAG